MGSFEITSCTFVPSGNDYLLTIVYRSRWANSRADEIIYRVFDGESHGHEKVQTLDTNTHDKGEVFEGKYVLKE
jgi:hypothetical protein